MNPNEFDYYLIEDSGEFAFPLLKNDDEKNSGGTMFLREMRKVDTDMPVHLVFNSPIPRKPEMVDYHFMQCRAVFSQKIYEVLKDIEIKDFQLVPAIVNGSNGEVYRDYWIAGIYRDFAFLDKDKSKFMSINSSGRWSMIEKMVIDKEEMAKVPLEERLIYVGKESSAYVYYHKSIVDAIMSVDPTGVSFIHVEEWSD